LLRLNPLDVILLISTIAELAFRVSITNTSSFSDDDDVFIQPSQIF